MRTAILAITVLLAVACASVVTRNAEERGIMSIPNKIPLVPALTGSVLPGLLPNNLLGGMSIKDPTGSIMNLTSNIGKPVVGLVDGVPVLGSPLNAVLGGVGVIGKKSFSCRMCIRLMPPVQWAMRFKMVYWLVEKLCMKKLKNKGSCTSALKTAQNANSDLFCRSLHVCSVISTRQADGGKVIGDEVGIAGFRDQDYAAFQELFAALGEDIDELEPLIRAFEEEKSRFV